MIHVTTTAVWIAVMLVRVVAVGSGFAVHSVIRMRRGAAALLMGPFVLGRSSNLSSLQIGQSPVERVGDLLRTRDPNTGFGCRNAVPQIRDPRTVLGPVVAQNDQQVRLRGNARTPPSAAYQLRLHGEPFPRAAGPHRQQNSGPGHGRSQEPAPQLHRNAPSRQA
ncbi:hypothetical protein [Streptomyces sp. NPDC050704]|uniref:hypothetical protein n=1 Tax=Streptomyces sp. NPDC050704 TaxID=3157219 RepID=UPI00341C7A2F